MINPSLRYFVIASVVVITAGRIHMVLADSAVAPSLPARNAGAQIAPTSSNATSPSSPAAKPSPSLAVAAVIAEATADVNAEKFDDSVKLLESTLAATTVQSDRISLEQAESLAEGLWGNNLLTSAQYGQAIEHYQTSIQLATKVGDLYGEEENLGNIGSCYDYLGEYDKALEMDQQSLALATKIGDQQTEEHDLGNIGNIYEAFGQYARALNSDQQSLALATKIGDLHDEEVDLCNIGIAYDELGQYRKALEYDLRSLALATKIGDGTGEEKNLGAIGIVYDQLGQYASALDSYRKSLALATNLGDLNQEERDYGSIGIVYTDLGQYGKALDNDRQSLALATKIGDLSAEAKNYGIIGIAYTDLGQYGEALESDLQSLALATKIGDDQTEEQDLCSIGIVYTVLGQYDKTLDNDQQSLALATKIGDVNTEEKDLGNIGNVYECLKQFAKALAGYQQSLALATKIGDISSEEKDLGDIGVVYEHVGKYEKALDSEQRSLALATKIGDVVSEEKDLCGIGIVYDDLGQYGNALDIDQRALILQKEVGDVSTEAVTLNNLMLIEQKHQKPLLAIYYGKESVNVFQTIRAGVQQLDYASQKSYLETVESTYRRLAEILINQGRLPEAEQVLAMLKDQEASDFVSRSAALSPIAISTKFNPREQAANANELSREDPVIATGRKLDALLALKSRTGAQAAQIVDLSGQLDAEQKAYQAYVHDVLPHELTAASPDTKRVNIADISPIQGQLKAMGPGTLAIITLVEPDFLREIVVTSQTQKVETSHVPQASLRKLIANWQTALENPNLNPRPLGAQVMDAIIGPIQADLDGDHCTTILFSLDDVLHYVPMAALYDGKHYLIEKYRVAVFSGATLAASPIASESWSGEHALLALGVTQPHTLPDPDTGAQLSFPALPGVAREIEEIAKTTASPSGILRGQTLEDAQFTERALRIGLAEGSPVVHIASHFELGAKDTDSFLLLGDGTALTLDKLFASGGRVFQGVDMLTLSACQTGEDVASSDGHQFESLGMVAEAQGAGSILASLWQVSDESTPLLMRSFYDKRAHVAGMTKAEALRQAQVAMIDGLNGAESRQVAANRSSSALPVHSSTEIPPFTPDPKAPYAHPYYWAPFVLIGDWK